MLSQDELKALEILAYFFYQGQRPQSALRTLKAILAIEPKNKWAREMIIFCEDSLEHYEKVESLTSNLESLELDKDKLKALSFLRARALQKLGRSAEAQALVAKFI